MVQRGLRDLDMVRRLMSSAKGAVEARTVKERLIAKGYTFAMSFYGVLKNKETSKVEYRRIEILLNVQPNERICELIYRLFQKLHPPQTYSIWCYDKDKDAISEVFSTW